VGVVIAAFLFSLAGSAIAFHPSLAGSGWMWLGFGLCQVPMAGLALRNMFEDGELREVLQPQWGDISLGMGSALVLLASAWAARIGVAPVGSTQGAWLSKAYDHAGEPAILERYWGPILAAVLLICALEEIAWRGMVLPKLEQRLGTRRAWPVAGLLYGLTFLPSVWWLRGDAGPNPLVVAAAVLAGVVWSFLAARTRRLSPSILSHAVFVWFVVVQFRLMSV
jgi:membrane protease YdiL (CAAX protease family)